MMIKVKYIVFSLLFGMLFAFTVLAADGQLSFSDPTANVGDTISLNMKVRSDTPLSRADITLRYDSNVLQFISGTDTDGGAGTIRVHGSGTQGENNALVYTIQFKALTAGVSSVSVEKQEVYSQDESLLNLTHVGSSKVSVNGASSTESSAEESTASSEESTEADKETVNEGVKLTAKDKSITIMNPGSDVQIPAGFLESTIDVDGHQVKGWVWKAESEHQYIILYGMNDAGDLSFYRYDLKEKTIQRYFQDPLEAEQKKNAENYPGLLGKYDTLVGKYNIQFILSSVFGFTTLLFIVLSAFLWQERNRLKRIISFQKEGIHGRELRPNVEDISMEELSFDENKEEDELDHTKMVSVVHKAIPENDLEDEDLGATRSISIKEEDLKRRNEKKVKHEDKPEDADDPELEIEDL